MLDSLKELDTALLLFINHLNFPLLDFIFYWISDKWIWIPFYAWLGWLIVREDKKNFFVVLVFIAAAITISDQLSSSVIKANVMRLRPCHNPEISNQVHLVNNYCGGTYGFVSSHAANVFALVTFISNLPVRKKFPFIKILWSWAIIVSFSRIYLGVHYPGDVICGAIVGIVTGIFVGKIYRLYIDRRRIA